MYEFNPHTAHATWQVITHAVSIGHHVGASAKGMKAGNVWVFSNPARDLHNYKGDEFTEDMITAVHAMTARYTECGSGCPIVEGYYKRNHTRECARGEYDRDTAYLDETPTYWIARDGEVIAYRTRGGHLVTRPAEQCSKRQADALKRLAGSLEELAARPFHP